jgi:RNA polymerase-binding transcription factor DksA
MATPRKTGASRPKAKPAKPAKSAPAKSAAAKRPVAKPAPAKAPAKPVVAKSTKPAPAAKPVAAKPVAAKPVAKTGKKPVAVPAKTLARKPLPAGKAVAKGTPVKGAPVDPKRPAGKTVIRVVSHGPVAQARPIGALPPEAVARAVKGHAPVATKPRPALPSREPRPSSGVEGVSEKDFKEFEQRLIAERQKIMKDMGYLESNVLKVNQRDSAGDLSGYSFHMADVGTDAYEREKAFLFASSEGRLIMDIDDALRKLYRGEYGRCEICEQPIARARLEAMPYARLCLACKEKQERENRGAV